MTPQADSTANVAWLDAELRKEKAIVATLRDLMDKQQVALTDSSQRIMSLEDRLAKLQAQLQRIPDLEESFSHTRDELVVMISDLRQEQQKRETDSLRNRMAEREQDSRTVQTILAELKRLDPIEQSLGMRQAEERRLNESILRTQQGLDELSKRALQREELARQIGERLEQNVVRTGQIEVANETTQKSIKEAAERVLLLETAQPKIAQQVAELAVMREELTHKHDELSETNRRADRERAQTLTEWGRRLEGFNHQLDTWAEQLRYFTDQHDKNRRILREVQELAQQVSQQQDQLRQAQRISQDQIRHEMREWRSEIEHRLAQENAQLEAQWEAQTVLDDGQSTRLADLEELRQRDLAAAQAIYERIFASSRELGVVIELHKKTLLRLVEMEREACGAMHTEVRGLLGEGEK
jgi:chromosome segregation ATPase